MPGRTPSSISACLTHARNTSKRTPNRPATRLTAPPRDDSGSRPAPNTIRITRHRNPTPYFPGTAITLNIPSPELKTPTKPKTIQTVGTEHSSTSASVSCDGHA